MKRFSEQFHDKALSVTLKAAERAELRERVLSYMEYHPLPEAHRRTIPKSERVLLTEPYQVISLRGWRSVQVAGVGVLLLCSLVSWRAEHAIPGDALYAVKVSFNEEVRSTLTFTPYEKIAWETERLSRRLAEARVLASEGRLTEEAEASVAAAVRGHGEKARREIAALETTDRDEAGVAALHLATTLDVQSAALRGATASVALMATGLADEAQGKSAESSLIADVVAAELSQTVLPHDTALPSYQSLLAHAERDTTRARELLSAIKGVATPEESADIKRRIEDVDRTLARALGMVAEDQAAAQALLRDVLQRTQRLIVFMTNIDVRSTVSVDALVPVERTAEEQVVEVHDTIARLRTTRALIETALASSSIELSVEVKERAEATLVQLDTLSIDIEAALTASDMNQAEVSAREAFALAEDTFNLIAVPATMLIGGEVVEEGEAATSTATSTDVVDENGAAGLGTSSTSGVPAILP